MRGWGYVPLPWQRVADFALGAVFGVGTLSLALLLLRLIGG